MALKHKGAFSINGKEWNPKSLKINYESIQGPSTGRTMDGILHIDWVLRKIRKLEIEMAPMTIEQFYELLADVQGKEYNITYFDPLENQEKTIYVYTSNSNLSMYSGVVRNGLYQGFTFHAIELAGEN